MIPERIASLTLLSTAARLVNTVVSQCYNPLYENMPRIMLLSELFRASAKPYISFVSRLSLIC